MKLNTPAAFVALLLFSPLTLSLHASERRFTYTYSTLTSPSGEIELENWATYKSRPGVVREFEFRHELEIGLTDKTQIGLYLANWSIDGRSHASRYQSSSVEVIHNFTNPITDLLGSAVYVELTAGEHAFEIENKLLLEKRIGRWSVAWNGGIEASWEGSHFGDLQEATGELSQSFGVSYDFTKSLSLGAELLHELPLGKWHHPSNPELYVGPNITFRKGRFYTSLSGLFQTTDRKSEQNFQARAVVGIRF